MIESVPRSGTIKVEAGQPVELSCKVLKGSPVPEVTWRRQVKLIISQRIFPNLKIVEIRNAQCPVEKSQ